MRELQHLLAEVAPGVRIAGVVEILVCSYFLAAPKRYASYVIRKQNEFWGFQFGDKTLRGTIVLVRLIGLIGIGFGPFMVTASN
jgi:hypothetical protein